MSTPVSAGGRWSYRTSQDRRPADLPVLPSTVGQLLALDQDRTEFFEELSAIVEAEPSLALRLVALANSAAYQRGKPVSRVREAAVRVGAEAALDVVLAASVAKVFVPRRPWERALWVHALRVAAYGRCLAEPCDPREICPDTAYLAGLLHELGRFVLFHEAPWVVREVGEAGRRGEDARKAERAAIGIDHHLLGAEVAARWGLPGPLVQVLLHFPDDDAPRLGQLVRAADALDPTEGDPTERPTPTALADRLRPWLPSWHPWSVERLVTRLIAAAEDARHRARVLFPGSVADD